MFNRDHFSRLFLLFILVWGHLGHQVQGQVFTGERLLQAQDRLTTEERGVLESGFQHIELYSLDIAAIHAHVSGSQGASTLRLVLGEHDLDLLLEPHDLRAVDMRYQVATDQGVVDREPAPSSTYRGRLLNGDGAQVRFSIRHDAILGYVMSDPEELYIEPLAHITRGTLDDRYVVYRLADLIVGADVSCGVTHMEEIMDQGDPDARGGNPCRLANIGLAADGSMVNFLGSVGAVEDRMLDLLNWVDGKYQEPAVNIAYQLVSLFISSSTANDPWSATQDAPSLLQSFRNWGNSGGFGAGVQFAVATLWTRRDIQSNGNSGTIGLAYVGVVCTQNRYNLCEHYTTATAGPRVVMTHELGHNWNAPHTTTAGQWIMAPTANVNNTNWNPGTIDIIVAHKNSRTCLGSSCLLLPVVDFAANSTLSCDGTVAFTDQSMNEPDSWLWEFGDGNTSTLQDPIHTYASSGNYTVQLTAFNSTGQGVEIKESYISVDLLPPPVGQGAEVCAPGGTADLSATGSYELLWYTTPAGGTPVNTGPVFGPQVSSTTTWYVEDNATPAPAFGGALANTIGSGDFFTANDNWGLRFNVSAPSTLATVKVYASGAGNRTIQLLDASNNVVESRVVNIPNGESRIDLDLDLPVGQQFLLKLTGTNLGLYRNDAGGSFPYEVGGTVTITATNATGQATFNYYYYFYDWEVQEPGCASVRTPVTAEVVVCAGIDDMSSTGGLLIRPNPSDGLFLLDWSDMRVAPARMEVINATGQRVQERSVEGRSTLELALDGAAGMYFLRVFDRQGGLLMDRRLLLQ
jgi:PKD repeat protein